MSFALSSKSEHSDEDHDQPPARNTPDPNHRRTNDASEESHAGPIRRVRGSDTTAVNPGRSGRTPSTVPTQTTRANTARGELSRPGLLPPVPGLAQSPAIANPSPRSNPTNRILEGWPHPVAAMNHQDEPVDDEFVDRIEGIFQLQGAYAELAEQLAYVPAPRQYVVSIYSMLAFQQAIERLSGELLTIHRPLPTETATPAARGFHYVSVFSDFVKRTARNILMSRSCAVYGSDQPRNSPRRSKSLLTLVLEAINNQNTQFKRDYLPRGYIDGELAALGSVDTFVRDKLRNSRGKMRDLLLTNIHAGAGREILHPVPTISALLVQMKASFTPPIAGAAELPEPQGNQSLLKARLAYLRIQTIIQFAGRGGGDVGRQWKNIDEHLCELSLKRRPYRSAFYQLVLAYDHATFGHDLWTEMDSASIALPTEEESLARMEANESTAEPALQDDAADF
ncbi:hypothetical protein PtA15_1A650 [Puccinia triticina]|uniref:Ras-GEF domain-containing protein n=1 Tax=Puccinia triticina TaxID=208348 RepID=A0ABY7C811_9BASI|nr:uncharacterized protein PtA15_1A650 [Puccinia triticina]WAQ81310.1 hypothetical protein PtA15_1A650 [Puccinia triticina]